MNIHMHKADSTPSVRLIAFSIRNVNIKFSPLSTVRSKKDSYYSYYRMYCVSHGDKYYFIIIVLIMIMCSYILASSMRNVDV